MSSHHFVKENQEPALIIANGQSCEIDLLNQLLEWSPLVIVLDGAINRVIDLGIKFDVLLGDFDHIENNQQLLSEQSDIKIIHTPDQNKTDLEKAIEFLIQKGQKAVNIVWATGLRMDHTFNNIITLAKYTEQISCVMLDNYSRIFVLPKRFIKYYVKGQVLSLFPLGDVSNITTQGLLYNLNNESLTLPQRTGSSNECIETGTIEISYKNGFLVLMECTD